MTLHGRVATITGAGRGIGAEIAAAFARAGASVIIADRDLASAESTARSIVEAGGTASAFKMDVTSESDAVALVAHAVERHGKLDIHVNNAGISTTKLFVDTTIDDFSRIMDVNFLGSVRCAQAAIAQMRRAGYGRIINITSVSGQRGGVGRAAYGASKAALTQVSSVMSVELAHCGITINNIAPGAIATELSDLHHDKATRDAYHAMIPERRYGKPKEVADAAVFLASDAAAYICGQTLNVDGGFLTAGLMFDLAETP